MRARWSTPPGTLPSKLGGSTWPSPVIDEVGLLEALGQMHDAGHEVEARLDAGAQGDEPAGQPSGRTGAGDGGDVDGGEGAVAAATSSSRR